MLRVTHHIMKEDLIKNVQNNHQRLDKIHNQLSTGKRVRFPGEDPVKATHTMLHRTKVNELNQFMENIENGMDRIDIIDGSIKSFRDILHRFEELMVQSANGIYQQEDRIKISYEAEELLKEMVAIANSKFKGQSVFAGHKSNYDPFRIEYGQPQLSDGTTAERELISRVIYQGDIGNHMREIDQQEYMPVNVAGNRLFWATEEYIESAPIQTPGGNFSLQNNGRIRIDGKVIQLNTGDTLAQIKDKINAANIEVEASLKGEPFGAPEQPSTQQSLILTATTPHQIWLEDIDGGTALKELNLLDTGQAPNMIAPGAKRESLSIFDAIIEFRNNLLENDSASISGKDIGNLQKSLDNVLRYSTSISAKTHRLEVVRDRVISTELTERNMLARAENVDMEEAVVNLKMLEYLHNVSLSSGAKIVKPTLLDFLR